MDWLSFSATQEARTECLAPHLRRTTTNIHPPLLCGTPWRERCSPNQRGQIRASRINKFKSMEDGYEISS